MGAFKPSFERFTIIHKVEVLSTPNHETVLTISLV